MDLKNTKKYKIIFKLKKMYSNVKNNFNFKTPFELLVATILSAQTNDIQVNKITKELFKVAKKPQDILNLSKFELIKHIKQIGLYNKKQKYISLMSYQLINKFNGIVPQTLQELMSLSGVGRKTANVVLSNAFGIPSIAVDTHVFRVSNRLGLVNEKNVKKTESSLKKILHKKDWIAMHNYFIFHGRILCKAKNPLCYKCILKLDCKYYNKKLN